MSTITRYIACALLVAAAASCKKDNYDAPSVSLKGRITYKGEAINVSSEDVTMELWEPGWGKSGAITVNVSQDGSYSALLFNGTYKLVIPKAQGPFMSLTNKDTHSDTIPLQLHGSQTLDIEVMPYYMIRNPRFTLNGTTAVNAALSLEKVITDANARDVESVSLYINQTSIVDGINYVGKTTVAASAIPDMSNISLSLNIPASLSSLGTTGSQHYAFVRIGIKISGVEDMLFSPVQEVQLQ